jgi:flagellar biosynthetic protein FlhB
MAEESGQEKTLEPTAKRLGEAREQGNVPRSRYLSHLLILGTATGALSAFSGSLRHAALQWMTQGLTFDVAAATTPAAMGERFTALAFGALVTLAPIFGLLCVAAAAGPIAMAGGLLFNLELALPNPERLNPITGFSRLFSVNGLIELVKAILIVAVLGSIAYVLVHGRAERYAGLASEGLPQALSDFGDLLFSAILVMVFAVGGLALVEAPVQWIRHRQQLRMTPEEVKREHKDSEGDPRIKGRIRNAMRQMARKRMMAAVPKADVVVTNPEHYAVALRYQEEQQSAPVVVAKGHDAVAEAIKALAREHRVPLLEAPPLARALHRHVEIGEPIPGSLYQAVAQVLAYVHQLRRYAAGAGQRPVEPRGIDVPDGMDPLQAEAGR